MMEKPLLDGASSQAFNEENVYENKRKKING
jgi:hypothetical protein